MESRAKKKRKVEGKGGWGRGCRLTCGNLFNAGLSIKITQFKKGRCYVIEGGDAKLKFCSCSYEPFAMSAAVCLPSRNLLSSSANNLLSL